MNRNESENDNNKNDSINNRIKFKKSLNANELIANFIYDDIIIKSL